MNRPTRPELVHQPNDFAAQHPPISPPRHHPIAHELANLTPVQHEQIRALVAHAVALASHEQPADVDLDETKGLDRSPLSEPGVWIVLVLLTLIAAVAIVATVAVLALAVIGA